MDLVAVVLEAAFFVVFAGVLARYLREPTAVNRDLVLVFGSVVALFAISIAGQLVALPQPVRAAAVIFLLAQPYLTLRLVRHFASMARWVDPAAVAWFLSAAAAYLFVGNTVRASTIYIVAYFVVVELVGAAVLLRTATGRFGTARLRLVVAAFATTCFALTILVSAISTLRTPPGATADPTYQIVSRTFALIAGLGYLGAFVPPRFLRRLQQRALAFDLAAGLVSVPTGTPADTFWQRLAEAAQRITGADSALVAIGSPVPTVRVVTGTWDRPPAIGEAIANDDPRLTGGVPATKRRNAFVRSSADRVVSVPLAADDAPVGYLVTVLPGASLFVEDDHALLSLIGTQTVRAVEREQALQERSALANELLETSHELEQSREQLESEARFRVAVEAHPSPLLVLDDDGHLVYANAQAMTAFGYERDELLATRIGALIPELKGTRIPDRTEQGIVEVRRRNGTTFPAELSVRSFEFDGQTLRIAVLVDVTDRIQVEQVREKFIGILSHELRTPVTAIYGGTQLLLSRRDRIPPDQMHDLLADMAFEGERLNRIIENLVVLARLERGRELQGEEPVLLQRVLPVVLERERALWPDVAIRLALPPNLPTTRGDEGYVAQVVRNLVSNAAKYAGGRGEIEVQGTAVGDGVEIRVLDRGPGIREDTADQLFELYYREPSAGLTAPGAGIGLFICRQIVNSLGGRMWARPRPGGGAEFGFSLPIYEADDERVAQSTSVPRSDVAAPAMG